MPRNMACVRLRWKTVELSKMSIDAKVHSVMVQYSSRSLQKNG